MQNKLSIYKQLCDGIKEIKGMDFEKDEMSRSRFRDLGFDSLEFIQLVVYLETNCGYYVSDELLAYSDRSVDEFIEKLTEENECYK